MSLRASTGTAALASTLALMFAILTARAATPTPSAAPLAWLKAGQYAPLDAHYTKLQREYEAGRISDAELLKGARELYEDAPANAAYFEAWASAFPHSYVAQTARGAYYYRMAWAARGTQYVNATPEGNLETMETNLEKAGPLLLASLPLTKKPFLSVLYLLNVSQMIGTQEESRHWFDVGNRMDPHSSALKRRYMMILEPRWGGSYEQMLGFRAECARAGASPVELAQLDVILHEDALWTSLEAHDNAQALAHLQAIMDLADVTGEAPSSDLLSRYLPLAWNAGRHEQVERALRLLTQRNLDQGWMLAEIAWIYVQQKREIEAWPYLQKAASLGDPWAEYGVGKTLLYGCPAIRLPAAPAQGMEWIRHAAEQGYAPAKSFLAHGLPAPSSGESSIIAGLGSPSAKPVQPAGTAR